MNALIFDGEEMQSINRETSQRQLSLTQTVRYYQTSLVWRHAAKEFFAEQGHWHLNDLAQLGELETGLDLLYRRMVLELGEEMANLVVARTSADIIFAACVD
jgi:hypothetical protein